jgi:hypothetical protein
MKHWARFNCWILPRYGPFLLGARFETYGPVISLIFQYFPGRGKTRILNQWVRGHDCTYLQSPNPWLEIFKAMWLFQSLKRFAYPQILLFPHTVLVSFVERLTLQYYCETARFGRLTKRPSLVTILEFVYCLMCDMFRLMSPIYSHRLKYVKH